MADTILHTLKAKILALRGTLRAVKGLWCKLLEHCNYSAYTCAANGMHSPPDGSDHAVVLIPGI